MKNIKFTIGVPVHNSSLFLEKCLESIISQTYPFFEVICVDDFSTDNSLEILKKYCQKDKRINLIVNSSNKGILKTREIIVKSSNSDFFVWCDSDDELSRDLLFEANKIILNQKNKNICIFHNAYVIDDNLHNPHLLIKGKKANNIVDAAIMCSLNNFYRTFPWLYVIPTYSVKQSFQCLPDDDFKKYVDDVLITWRYFLSVDKVVFDERPFYYYYYRSSSDSTDQKIIERLIHTTKSNLLYLSRSNISIKDCYEIMIIYQNALLIGINDVSNDSFNKIKGFSKQLHNIKLSSKNKKYFSSKDRLLIFVLKFFPYIFFKYYSNKKTRYKKDDKK